MAEKLWASANLATLNLYPGYPVPERDENGRWKLVFLYFCGKDSAKSLIPATSSAPPEPWGSDADFSALRPRFVRISATRAAGVVDVRIEYLPRRSYSITPGETRRSTQAGRQIRPIEEHPDLTDAQKALARSRGRREYSQRTISYSYEQVHSSFTWSQSNLISGVGQTGTPTGMTGATSAAWLLTSRELQEEEEGTIERRTWEYDKNLWQSGTF